MAFLSVPTLAVLASVAVLIHATLCAIQRAPANALLVPTGAARCALAPRAAAPSRPKTAGAFGLRPSTVLFCAALHVACVCVLCADRDYLKAVQQPFVYPPFEITVQCIGAVLFGTWGVLGLQGSFMPIRTTEVLAKQTIDNLEPGPDFVHFNTRELR